MNLVSNNIHLDSLLQEAPYISTSMKNDIRRLGYRQILSIHQSINTLPSLPNSSTEFVGYSINGSLLICIDHEENIRYVLLDNHWVEMVNRRENLEYYSPVYLFTMFLELNLLGCYNLVGK